MVLLSIVVLLVVIGVVIYRRIPLPLGSAAVALTWYLLGYLTPAFWSLWLVVPLAAVLLILNVPALRRPVLSKPVFQVLGKAMPSMSTTEREALEAGTTWWEKDLFSGRPDWHEFAQIGLPQLTQEEQSFLDNEVEELCAMLDEFDIHHHRKDLPEEAWQFLKDKGFLGLIIPKEFGGRDFGPYAQSRIMSKIASRSGTTAVTAMVPNSLGPGELLMKYGTDEQKQRWLPGLANGTEIPCFGLTGPEAGSDAGSIPDVGIVCKGEFEGQEVLGLKLTFSKRWITLAPVATVVGLAFKLHDPDGLLGDSSKSDYGITCALLPANHPGVEIGKRHHPGSPFMNGPIKGQDVFIPVDWIIGGAPMAGKGWRMLIECLGAGRGISLPALATASGEMLYRTVGAYARIRRQFNTEVGKFEGVQEATADIASCAYTMEAFRQMVTKGLETGSPSVMTAMAKYHATEMMRRVVNHSMDVVGGRAIQHGPRNFLALPYQSVPVAITVEGANILTRSLMIFGQGAMRCHPYLFDELQAIQAPDQEQGLKDFDKLFIRHMGHLFSNLLRVKLFGITRARFSGVPENANEFSRRWYQRINLLSAGLAVTSDMALGILGGDLKRRELLSARLGDVHSQLFIACAILKFHSAHARTDEEDAHAEYALRHALYTAQEALYDFYRNFPKRTMACALKWMVFPLGRVLTKPDDNAIRTLGGLILEDNPVRKAFRPFVYENDKADDPIGRVETTYQMLLSLEPTWSTFVRAQAKGELTGETLDERLEDAATKGLIRNEDIARLKEYDAKRYDCLLTDAFDKL
ncbi:acyl-CoA dehydrogenase [Marinimicrobium sp.]|jgi:acyl-CoA dehydrogenase|uniref:acyl-CoA dehydrogenase n=4 Tax=unclassified Marinimicrobium TaxID=2632100 RepID=UPI000C59B939|nr:acyl-CoA dehydrogenase [Marinimicrobium sp.]MAN51422.1 acyl-CoA dehydrogenase [Marinimicrobium sp.]